jgi:16S rRNA (adenine1518-N6/adenine1519-N6)-dimethyltransferase
MPSIEETKYFKTISEYKLLAKHEVGQNFLVDSAISERIVSLACLQFSDKVLEIGSGAGSLSFFISQSPSEADLIDIDESLVLKLRQDFSEKEKIHPQLGNIMKWDLAPYTKIIGNLPYYITSGILERILLDAGNADLAVLMVQKEVVARLTSKVGSKDYGPLPILLSYRADLKKEFLVSRTSFVPAPHIDSMVFVFSFKKSADGKTAGNLYALVSRLFLHRRKTILNNLGWYMKDTKKALSLLRTLKIDEKKRPEALTLEDYLAILSQLY